MRSQYWRSAPCRLADSRIIQSNNRTKSAASLWTLYIDFEVKNGEYKRAKSLIYRAIRECPWCKGTRELGFS